MGDEHAHVPSAHLLKFLKRTADISVAILEESISDSKGYIQPCWNCVF